MHKKKRLLWVNLALVVLIGVVVGIKYYKSVIRIQYKYEKSPVELVQIIESNFDSKVDLDKLAILFVFNRHPYKSELEIIEKLDYKYKTDVQVAAVFTKKFRITFPISFTHCFLGSKRFELTKNTSLMTDMFFVILNGKKLVYADDHLSLTQLVMLVQNNLFPDRDYEDYVISPGELKQKISDKLKLGPIEFYEAVNRKESRLTLVPHSKVLFYHTECSPCALKSILSRLKLKSILDGKDQIIIFSALADSVALRKALLENHIDFPVYVDKKDNLNVLTIITKDLSEPLDIELNEIKKKET